MNVNELIKVLEFTRDIEQMGDAQIVIETESDDEFKVLIPHKKISFTRDYKEKIFILQGDFE